MKKETLKSKVFKAAWNLVEKKGMAKLNARKVAQESQVSLGSIYNAFDNLESLQLHINSAVLANLFFELQKDIAEGIEKNKTLTAIFKDLGCTYIRFGQENLQLWKSVFEHFNTDDIPTWYKEKAQDGVNKICAKLSAHFHLPLTQIQHQVGFFWASMQGMSAILLNKKLGMVADLFKETTLEAYIDYCLQGL